MWLDKKKTSSYTLFQYFINLSDLLANKLLLQLTNINEQEYSDLLSQDKNNRTAKIIQHELARRFISKIHSKQDYLQSFELSNFLFKEKYNEIREVQIQELIHLPSIKNKPILLMDQCDHGYVRHRD